MLTLKDQSLLIEGSLISEDWVSANSGKTIPVDNPATGAIIGNIPDCGRAETEEAIRAAAKAFREWRCVPAAERARLLERWHDLILEHTEDLARIMTAEQGKPLHEAPFSYSGDSGQAL